MAVVKHILISNLLMLLIPYIALDFRLFSNQIHLLAQREIDILNSNILDLTPIMTNHPEAIITNDSESTIEESPSKFINQNQSIMQISPISQLTRYIYSHCQFDGVHFLTNTYSYQPNFAFIKGYTTLIQAVNFLVGFVFGQSGFQIGSTRFSSFEIQAAILIIINKIFFSLSAIQIQKIAFSISQNHNQSQRIAIFFLYNPACIFFHSVYTQSIYTFLTFTSILQLFKSSSKVNIRYLMAIGSLSLAVFFRTNGIFLAPAFGLPIIFQLWLSITKRQWKNSCFLVFKGLIVLLLILAPLLWYQYFTYRQMCHSQIDLIHDQDLIQQCSKTLPNLYNFIQRKFWSVGFFSYWKPSNFVFILLGLPAILVSLGAFRNVSKEFLEIFKKGDVQMEYKRVIQLGLGLSFLILLVITVTLTNIQSSTRFLSSHVIFYIILGNKVEWKIIRLWIFLYLSFGAMLFCIGFPWT